MDEELIEELDYEIDILIKSGFFSEDEIFEIIEDEFIDEDVDLDLSYRTSLLMKMWIWICLIGLGKDSPN